MKMINKTTGEAVYFNPIRKNGKDAWIIQGIGSMRHNGIGRLRSQNGVVAAFFLPMVSLPPGAASLLRFFHWKKRRFTR